MPGSEMADFDWRSRVVQRREASPRAVTTCCDAVEVVAAVVASILARGT